MIQTQAKGIFDTPAINEEAARLRQLINNLIRHGITVITKLDTKAIKWRNTVSPKDVSLRNRNRIFSKNV